MNTITIRHNEDHVIVLDNLNWMQLRDAEAFLTRQKKELFEILFTDKSFSEVEGCYDKLRHINEQLEKIINYTATNPPLA